jgi:thiol peroxidase
MSDRTGVVTFLGNPLTLTGSPVAVGDAAPSFTVLNGDLEPVDVLALPGKVKILVAVPSLDTPVCDVEARRFNEEAAGLGDDVSVAVISEDLPFAQARWCGAAGVDQVTTYSDYKDVDFGTKYGILIKELRLLARTVLVVDETNVVRYLQIVPEVADEPDYDAALAAAKELV